MSRAITNSRALPAAGALVPAADVADAPPVPAGAAVADVLLLLLSLPHEAAASVATTASETTFDQFRRPT